MKNIREWFPQAEVTDHPNPPVGYVAIPLQAQQLYLHRNSLQYKIDKWEELTGLQLKNLTDLALCYHLVLQDVI